MKKPDRVEVYLGDDILATVDSAHAPAPGELINIRKITYRVRSRTYTIDHADKPFEAQMVCVLDVEPGEPSR
jgi:hypothetical protein